MQKEFEFFITKVYHGVGAARKLGDIVKKVGAKKVMVFHGPNVKAPGLSTPASNRLKRRGFPYVVYDKVEIESPMHSIGGVGGSSAAARAWTPASPSAEAAAWTPPRLALHAHNQPRHLPLTTPPT